MVLMINCQYSFIDSLLLTAIFGILGFPTSLDKQYTFQLRYTIFDIKLYRQLFVLFFLALTEITNVIPMFIHF